MQVELVSPENILYSGEADVVIARTAGAGDIAFLRDHAPFIGALDIAELRVKQTDGTWVSFAVHGGFVEVSNNTVTVLSDVAELRADIDVARATEAQQRAAAGDAEDAEIAEALRRANVRLAVASAASNSHA